MASSACHTPRENNSDCSFFFANATRRPLGSLHHTSREHVWWADGTSFFPIFEDLLSASGGLKVHLFWTVDLRPLKGFKMGD